ncbi:MAG: histidine kinase [Saonia sp.]
MSFKKRKVRKLVVHIFLWALFYGLMLYPFIYGPRTTPADMPARLSIATVLFYFNYFYLVPKLLLEKRTVTYITTTFLLIIAISLFIDLSIDQDPPRRGPTGTPSLGNGLFRVQSVMPLLIITIPVVVSTMLRMYVEWRGNEDLRMQVENEKVRSELQFLKTQLNPHFLFNSLNAIYSLSVKNSTNTSEAIISLSELMRYMLYETNKDFVPLAKELEYIKNYVRLQRLRLADSENVILKISGEDKGKLIPPLLFISFIENAFKYGTDFKGQTNVKINLSIKEESIHMYVMNTIGTYKEKSKNSGVGLENVKNRLNLLYPGSYNLLVKNDEKSYAVSLTLNL